MVVSTMAVVVAMSVVVNTLFVVVVRVTVSFFGPEATSTAAATPSPSARAATAIRAIRRRLSPPPDSSSGGGGDGGKGVPALSHRTRRGFGGGGVSGEDIAQDVHCGIDIVFADHERRQETKHARAGNVNHQPSVEGPEGDVAGVEPLGERHADHQPASADLDDRLQRAKA